MVDFIALHCALSKSAIKKALTFGGGWVYAKSSTKPKRVRRATKPLRAGEQVAFYYDDSLYTPMEAPTLIQETADWGIWFKPANVPSQGTRWGDANSLETQVAKVRGHHGVFAVHRLDREAAGLVVIAYHKKAAARLSALWAERGVEKTYHAAVWGTPTPPAGTFDSALDGKSARTDYRVVGDPKYGGSRQVFPHLCLTAVALNFDCPISGEAVSCVLDRALWIKP